MNAAFFGLALVFISLNGCQGFLSNKNQMQWNDLRGTFEVLPWKGFHKIPRSTSDKLINDYVKTEAEEGFTVPVDFYCLPNDPRICWMYDKKGAIAGVQISFLEKDVSNIHPATYNYSSIPGYVATNFMDTPAFSFRAFFTDPSTLTEEGRKDTSETAEGLWVNLNGEYIQISRAEPDVPQEGFTKQACFNGMGQHYFYKTAPERTCEEGLPFFPLYQHGQLAGFGIVAFGKATDGPSRVWYERPPLPAVKMIAPNRNCCLDHWVCKYGIFSFHVYFVDKPWTFMCPASAIKDQLKGLVACPLI